MSDSTMASFESLPPEIREHILLFLDSRSLLSASCVSTTWYGRISPVTIVWRRACQRLSLQVREGRIVNWMMCRALFVRLVLRLRSIEESCCLYTRVFAYTPAEEVTAIYYYNEKLATGSRCGKIKLWTCPPFECKWISRRHSSSVTSIKFDDHIVLASYADGSIASWNCLTGRSEKTYTNPCVYAVTVDYLTAANLVVSANSSIVGWNMTEGNLVLRETLGGRIATKIVIKQYPSDEDPNATVEKILITIIVQNHLEFWSATSTGENIFRMRSFFLPLGGFPQRRLFSKADKLHFVGRFLYLSYLIRGVVHQWDVFEDREVVHQRDVVEVREVAQFNFRGDIRCLVGVGEKYIMVITTNNGENHLKIMEKQSSRIIISYPVASCHLNPRYSYEILPSDFCLGETSWLDGFDGDNDSGAVCIFATYPNLVHVIQWSERTDQLFLRNRYPNCLVAKPPRWDNIANTV